ncbi:MerR family transcriptional regulator [Paenibacillus aurantius]|uniref:MerR family transcriptional regulator n=1 Tax=Paenibacillus aurantius TaxID=2918900 RepID=A0AA96RHH0_9BACL|nr:MerR family transcriptional regulator [Paenibacillus aurantius]WNQ11099.1 MerR family transcriptional regulator [Paenibacillus aurantius]
MYTIRQAAEMTGFSPDTLRYYEKIGLVESPERGPGGVRSYSSHQVQRLASLHCLKKTGLSLEEMKEFLEEGQCLANRRSGWSEDEIRLIRSRSRILAKHLRSMEKQREEMNTIIEQTKEKLRFYEERLPTEQEEEREGSL